MSRCAPKEFQLISSHCFDNRDDPRYYLKQKKELSRKGKIFHNSFGRNTGSWLAGLGPRTGLS